MLSPFDARFDYTAMDRKNKVPPLIRAAPAASPVVHQPVMPVRAIGVSFSDPSHGWLLGDAGQDASRTIALAATVDGGATWNPMPLPPRLNAAYDWDTVSQIQGGVYFVTAKYGWIFYRGLYSTDDGGLTWSEEAANGAITRMERAPDGTVWALEKTNDTWTVDGGKTWKCTELPNNWPCTP